ncbi:MAG: hypothetical protein ACRCZM_03500 [Bacteroidales bacterium]
MLKQITKYTLSIFLIALLMLSGSFGLFKHLACNHCDVASLFQEQATTTQSKGCCSTNALGVNTNSLDDCLCNGDSAASEVENREAESTNVSKTSVDLIKVPIISLIKKLTSSEVELTFPHPTSTWIASGRDILALNAVLII